MRSPVHIIPEEKVVCVRQLPSHFEYLHYVEELAMDIAYYSDRERHPLHVLLLH